MIIDKFVELFIKNNNIKLDIVTTQYKNNLQKLIEKEVDFLKKHKKLSGCDCVAEAINNVGKSFLKVVKFNYKPITSEELKKITGFNV